MVKFIYKNIKNIDTNHIFFKFNYGYYLYISYKKDIYLKLGSKSTKRLLTDIGELYIVYLKNFYHT